MNPFRLKIFFIALLLSLSPGSIRPLKALSHLKHSFSKGLNKAQGKMTTLAIGSACNPATHLLCASSTKSLYISKDARSNWIDTMQKLKKPLKLMFSISLWYFLSALYNIENKKALNALKNLPWFVATIQMICGAFIFVPMWSLGLREKPFTSTKEMLKLMDYLKNVSLFQTLTHAFGVIALGSGAVSFTQVVKASEPAFTAAISYVAIKERLPWQVYASLIPVIMGVAIASSSELHFSVYCLLAGILSNVFGAARGVFGKAQMCGEDMCITTLTPANYYAILTISSSFLLLPLMWLFEGPSIYKLLTNLASITPSQHEGLKSAFISGLLFYLYNEVSFGVLSDVHPIGHAVANVLKRIIIIGSSIFFFRNKLTPAGIFGSSLAIAGSVLYALCQYWFKPNKTTETSTKKKVN